MASTRDLKKELNYLTGELLTECVIYEQFHPESIEHSDEVMKDIVEKRNELITRINTAKKLDDHKEIKKEFNQIRDEIADLVMTLDNLGEGEKGKKKTRAKSEEPTAKEPVEEEKESKAEHVMEEKKGEKDLKAETGTKQEEKEEEKSGDKK
ncbi:MAG: hypothetical protein ACOC10_01655 [Bacteroidota bacterium]